MPRSTPSDPFQSPAAAPKAPKGCGAAGNTDVRFADWTRRFEDDGWGSRDADGESPATTLIVDTAKSVITRNDSPDVPFELSINPYRGCEHGCSYCFARPTHAYLGLSPGLDFETRIAYKPDAPAVLRRELARPGYRCSPIALGINTDGWQPVERRLGLTRALLEVLQQCRHPVSIVTKSALIERDLDLLSDMAQDNLVQVMFSVTTLDGELSRRMEPRAAHPARRLQAMRTLHEAGVPVGVLVAPLIPALNDHEMEGILEASRGAGAETAGYVLLRLPHEVRELFCDWLNRHVPGRAGHVMSLIRQLHGGRDYDSSFGKRMSGSGVFADVIAGRFRMARERLGFTTAGRVLDCGRFNPPAADARQLDLF